MSNRLQLGAAVVIALAAGAAGAGVYSAVGPTNTTTVVTATPAASTTQSVAATKGLSINEIYNRAIKGVVDIAITAPGDNSGFNFGGTQTRSAEGSGIVLDTKGNIVTNDHVVASATSITVTLWNGNKYGATLVGADPTTDLAVIKIGAKASKLHPLALADSNAVQVGDGVITIGSPFGYVGTVTSGIISALHRTMTSPSNYTIADSLQTDAPINHGNSGGPLLNALAQVIGINTQIQSNSGGSDGVGFAIPSNTISSVTKQLIAPGHSVSHAYLGVQIAQSSIGGAQLTQVSPGTPAAKAGLAAGDLITKLNGQPVNSAVDLSRIIDALKPGDTMSVTYVRGTGTHTVQVKLGTRPIA